MSGAPAVVAIHGAGGGGWEYDLWRPVFERAGFRFIARDLLPAPGGLESTRFSDYVEQAARWIPAGSRFFLVGASMGGILALKVAERRAPAGIVLVNSALPRGVGKSRPPKRYPSVVKWAGGPLKETRDAMPDSDERTILWAWKRWRDESGDVLNTIRGGVQVRRPRCPALVVLGEKDTDIPAVSGLELAKWAQADVHLYHGMSHVGPLMSRRAAEAADAAALWCRRRAS